MSETDSKTEVVDTVRMKNVDPKAAKESWVFLEEFCYTCLEKKIYFFCQTPVPRIAAFHSQQCRATFQNNPDFYIDRHNLFVRYLQEEEQIDHKGAIARALRRVLNPDPSVQ